MRNLERKDIDLKVTDKYIRDRLWQAVQNLNLVPFFLVSGMILWPKTLFQELEVRLRGKHMLMRDRLFRKKPLDEGAPAPTNSMMRRIVRDPQIHPVSASLTDFKIIQQEDASEYPRPLHMPIVCPVSDSLIDERMRHIRVVAASSTKRIHDLHDRLASRVVRKCTFAPLSAVGSFRNNLQNIL